MRSKNIKVNERLVDLVMFDPIKLKLRKSTYINNNSILKRYHLKVNNWVIA